MTGKPRTRSAQCRVAISRAISYFCSVRLVFDTAVMVASIRSDAGASRWLVRAALEARRVLTPVVSVPLLIEYEAVMTRAEHLRAARISSSDVGLLLDAFAAMAETTNLDFLWRPILPDAEDEMVFETAVNGRADAIITFNRRDFSPATKYFGVSVLSPGQTVQRLEIQTK